MESISRLTRSQICGNMYRAADNRQEPTTSLTAIRAELDQHTGSASKGAGDGGAQVVTITIVITISSTRRAHPVRAAVALGGGSVIDLHPVFPAITPINFSIQIVEGEVDCFSIG